MMKFLVARVTEDYQILNLIVFSIAIDVMDIKVIKAATLGTTIRIGREGDLSEVKAPVCQFTLSGVTVATKNRTETETIWIFVGFLIQPSFTLKYFSTQGTGVRDHDDRTFSIRHGNSVTDEIGHYKRAA